jgi:hypothetical protein
MTSSVLLDARRTMAGYSVKRLEPGNVAISRTVLEATLPDEPHLERPSDRVFYKAAVFVRDASIDGDVTIADRRKPARSV